MPAVGAMCNNCGHPGRCQVWVFNKRMVTVVSMLLILTATDSWRINGVSAHVLVADLVPAGPSVTDAPSNSSHSGQVFCRFTNDSTLPPDAMRKQFCCNITSHGIADMTVINIFNASINGTLPTNGSVISVPAREGNVSLPMHVPVFVGCAYNISWDVYSSVHDEVEQFLMVLSTTRNTTGGFKGQMYDGPGQMPANGSFLRPPPSDSSHSSHSGMGPVSSPAPAPAASSSDSHAGHTGTSPQVIQTPTAAANGSSAGHEHDNGAVKQERMPSLATGTVISLVLAAFHMLQILV